MRNSIKIVAAFAALVASNIANASFLSLDLTDELSAEIRGNGAYTLQTVNNELSIEYWLYDQLAMLRFSAEDINYIFYTPFVDGADNDLVNVTYSISEVYDGFYSDDSLYEIQTYQYVDYIDYVFKIDDGFSFTGLDFDNKEVWQDGVFTNRYATMYYEEFKVAALTFDTVGAENSIDVPEPSTFVAFGIAGLLLVRRRFSNKK
ncbi:PEP-CTERM sorting domain-containing protein [Alteromonas mediterranea]|uniref:PEP-CTERM sorting domain-containing protein n=1 Tax=Alteromonas mediterranea TaxID=314275 RepID=UPI0003555A74|nr:PEP-CTERM sorting domain-containing protein [Alteromonas mediterranea]AGP87123.1 hypothetical protein I607_16755 [Alteromonas mediterranea U4]AGP91108.1 hypothetical protein I876_16340 [Alteromonas mediterranea U7]AGP93569.1 hypothetical protein I634_09270 [Alteromonas mediterranea U8]